MQGRSCKLNPFAGRTMFSDPPLADANLLSTNSPPVGSNVLGHHGSVRFPVCLSEYQAGSLGSQMALRCPS
jgi:hypothetical protein